jgi:hypothetical protein
LDLLEFRLGHARVRRAHGHLARNGREWRGAAGPDDPLLAGKQTDWESNGPITRRVRLPEPA